MEATLNPTPAKSGPNWNMITRVGLVVGLIALLVGYALKITYDQVVQGGVVSKGDYYEVDLKAMSGFEMDQQMGTIADIPQRYRNLDGKKVLLKGEVAPGNKSASRKVDTFSLCYSVARCCFGGPMKVQHFVLCRALPGKTVINYDGQGGIQVYGTLHIEVKKEGGAIQNVFEMDVERVDPIS